MGPGADEGYRSSPYPHKNNRWLARTIILIPFQSFIFVSPRNMRWPPRHHPLHVPRCTHHGSPIPGRVIHLHLHLPRTLWLSRHTRHHRALEGHRTVMDTLIPFMRALSSATTFGDAVEARKVGAGTARLTAKLRLATDTGGVAASSWCDEFVVFSGRVGGGLKSFCTLTKERSLASASACTSLEFCGSAATRTIIMLQWSTSAHKGPRPSRKRPVCLWEGGFDICGFGKSCLRSVFALGGRL